MTTTLLMSVLLSVLIFSAVVLTVLLVTTRRYRGELRRAFGQASDRSPQEAGARPEPERERSSTQVQSRPLSPDSRERYLRAWAGAQLRFMDSPVVALSEADALVTQLLSERGFRTDDLPGRSGSQPVEHAPVLESYRAGRAIEQANSSDRADLEQVRRGMLHFRTVFEALVGSADDETAREPYAGQTPRATRPQPRQTPR